MLYLHTNRSCNLEAMISNLMVLATLKYQQDSLQHLQTASIVSWMHSQALLHFVRLLASGLEIYAS